MPKKLCLLQQVIKPFASVHFLQKKTTVKMLSQLSWKTITIFLSNSSLPFPTEDREEDSVCCTRRKEGKNRKCERWLVVVVIGLTEFSPVSTGAGLPSSSDFDMTIKKLRMLPTTQRRQLKEFRTKAFDKSENERNRHVTNTTTPVQRKNATEEKKYKGRQGSAKAERCQIAKIESLNA